MRRPPRPSVRVFYLGLPTIGLVFLCHRVAMVRALLFL